MLTIPPRHYCVIENPVVRDKDGKVIIDRNGEAKLAFSDLEIRFKDEPFPLYPGEILKEVGVKGKFIKKTFIFNLFHFFIKGYHSVTNCTCKFST